MISHNWCKLHFEKRKEKAQDASKQTVEAPVGLELKEVLTYQKDTTVLSTISGLLSLLKTLSLRLRQP